VRDLQQPHVTVAVVWPVVGGGLGDVGRLGERQAEGFAAAGLGPVFGVFRFGGWSDVGGGSDVGWAWG